MKNHPSQPAGRNSRTVFTPLGALLVLALACGALNAPAGTATWNVTGGGTWTTGGNWTGGTGSGGIPAAGDSVVIDRAIGSSAAITSTVKGGITCNDITFGGAVGGSTEAGWVVSGSTMTVASGSFTVNQLAAGQAVTLTDAGKIVVSSKAVTKLGAGTLVLSGAFSLTQNSNTVQNGALQLDSLAGPGFASSGTVVLGSAGGVGAQLILGASAATTMTVGSLQTVSGAGTCSIVGGASGVSGLTYHPTATGENFTGNLGGSSGNQANLSLSYSSGTSTLSGNCDFTGGLTVVKGTMTLSGNNTTCGGITIGTTGKGIVVLGSANAYPAGDGLTATTTTAVLDVAGYGATIGALNLNTVATGTSAIDDVSAGGTPTVIIASGSVANLGVIKNTTGTLSVTKSGAGTLTFYTPETYSGNTTITGGTLALGAGGSIAKTATIGVGSGATLDVSAAGMALTGASPVQTLAGLGTTGSGVVNAGSQTLTLNSSATLFFKADGTGNTAGKISVAGNVTLNANPVTINVANAILGPGTYRLLDCTGTLNNTGTFGTPTVTGLGIGGNIASISVTPGSAGHIDLVVAVGPSAYSITDSAGGALTAGGSDTLTITALNSSGTTLTTFNANQPLTFSGLNVVGANHPTVTDKTGAAVNFGTATTITFASGVATVGGVLKAYKAESGTVNCTDGTASSSTGTGSQSLSLTVSPAGLSQLVVATEPSATVTAGAAFTAQPAVRIEDAYGNIETADNSSVVTATVQTGTGPLTGTATATAAGGTATFSGLGAPTLAQSGLKLAFTDTPDSLATLNDATSITVNPDVASKLVIGQAITSPQVDGQSFTPSPTVKVEDQYGNVVNSDSSTVTASIASQSGAGTLGGSLTATANGTTGTATFSALNFALANPTAAETVQVHYADGSLTAVDNSTITVNPNLTITFTTPPGDTTAGATMSSVVVHAIITSSSTPVTDGTPVTLSIASGGGTLLGTLTQTTTAGDATFGDLSIRKAGAYTLKATIGAAAATSGSFNINAGSFSQLQVLLPGETTAPGTVSGKTGTAAGQHLNTAFNITVNAADAYFNLVSSAPGDSVAVTTSDADVVLSSPGTLAGGTAALSFTPTMINSSVTVTATDVTDGTKTPGTDSVAVYHQNSYYRSTATGNWSAVTTWQSSTDDGNTWAAATLAPEMAGNAADAVYITNNAGSGAAIVVTNTAAITVSNAVVYAGNTLVSAGATLNVGPNAGLTNLDVFGTVIAATNNASAVTNSGVAGGLVFEGGSEFLLKTTNNAAIPVATWATSSTCEYAPGTAGATVPAGLGQTFGNFNWNWAIQSGSANLAGALTNIQGNLTILSTNTTSPTAGVVKLFSPAVGADATYNLTIGGDFILKQGWVNSGGGGTTAGNNANYTANVFLGGNLVLSNNANMEFRTSTSNGTSITTFSLTGSSPQKLVNYGNITRTSGNDSVHWVVNSTNTLILDTGNLPLVYSTNSGASASGPITPLQDTLTVNGTLVCGANLVTETKIGGGTSPACVFTLAGGATLEIGDPNGITASGATGNIRTTTRSFSPTANYIYTGSSAQVPGNGLPATVNNLTLASGMSVPITVGNAPFANAAVSDVTGTLTANGAIIGYTVSGGKLVHGTFPVFQYGMLSGSFGTPVLVSGTETLTPSLTTGGNEISLVVANSAPVTTLAGYTRSNDVAWKILISDLLTNATDADGDPLVLTAVGASTNGVTVTTNSSYVLYTNPNNVADSFTYTVNDGQGGSATGTVSITAVGGQTGQGQTVTVSGSSATVGFAGIPGYAYEVQRSTNLTDWVTLETTNAPGTGTFECLDGFSDLGGVPSQAYYRLLHP